MGSADFGNRRTSSFALVFACRDLRNRRKENLGGETRLPQFGTIVPSVKQLSVVESNGRNSTFQFGEPCYFLLMAVLPPTGETNSQRRSQRVVLSTWVVVTGENIDKKAFSEQTQTVVVSAHGAMVALRAKVSIGQSLRLRNAKTEEEVACRVAYINPHQSEKREIGLDFIEAQPRFWHISFPPGDWSNRSPDAKGSGNRTKDARINSALKK